MILAHGYVYVRIEHQRRSGNLSGENRIVVLPGLDILAPPRVYALFLGTGDTALFTALDGLDNQTLTNI